MVARFDHKVPGAFSTFPLTTGVSPEVTDQRRELASPGEKTEASGTRSSSQEDEEPRRREGPA